MKKYFCTYEQSLDLKELGFDGSCFGEYRQWDGSHPWLQLYQDSDGWTDGPFTFECKAPLKIQTLDFFREKFGLNGITPTRLYLTNLYVGRIIDWHTWEEIELSQSNSYEEAMDVMIDKLINLAKSIKKI